MQAASLLLNSDKMAEMIINAYAGQQMRMYESIVLNNDATLKFILNKYPEEWIDGIYHALGFRDRGEAKNVKKTFILSSFSKGKAEDLLNNKFTKKQLNALKVLYENSWAVKYGKLKRTFSSDTEYWWSKKPPKSDIGILRLHGFIIIGKMFDGNKYYKSALIPLELRHAIKKFFESEYDK